jgi:hypothetical protein
MDFFGGWGKIMIFGLIDPLWSGRSFREEG